MTHEALRYKTEWIVLKYMCIKSHVVERTFELMTLSPAPGINSLIRFTL